MSKENVLQSLFGYPQKFSITVRTGEEGQDRLIRKENELKAERVLYEKASRIKDKENLDRDNEINELNDKNRAILMRIYELELLIQKETDIRNKIVEQQKAVVDYCNDIKEKYSDPEGTIESYKEEINDIQEQSRKLNEKYDSKIQKIEKDNKKLLFEYNEKLNLFNSQKASIVAAETKVADIKADLEQQKTTFEERAAVNKIKYDELEKKYANLQKKIYALQTDSEMRQSEKAERTKKMMKQAEQKEEIQRELEEMEKKNKEIEEQIADMGKQWKQYSTATLLTTTTERSRKGGKVASEKSFSTNPSFMK